MTMHFTIRVAGQPLEVTPWLPGSERPLHRGVYQRNFPAGPYSCWDGEAWCADGGTPDTAAQQREPSRHQAVSWRGLTAPAPGPCGTCRGEGVVETEDEVSGASRLGECPDC